MTNESAFPNVTHEELHFSINKYNNFHAGALDDTSSQIIVNNVGNNTSLVNITNSTIN